MTRDPRYDTISSVIDEVRPFVQRDGGEIELVAVEGNRVKVRLTGQCTSCALAGQTLGGIRRRLMQVLETPVMVVPVAD